jgi:hypothetical protein
LFGFGSKAKAVLAQIESKPEVAAQETENEIQGGSNDTHGEKVSDVAEGLGDAVSTVAKSDTNESESHGQAVSAVAKGHGEEVRMAAHED